MSISISAVLRFLGAVPFCFLWLVPVRAGAQPEVTGNLALGGGGILSDDPHRDGSSLDSWRGVFRFGLNSSITFGRDSNRDLGLGIYLEAMTSTFRDIMPGMGLQVLLPVHPVAPLVLFAGGHYDYDGSHAAGVSGRLWWGVHNHNLTGWYNMTYGLWVETRANLWGNRDLVVAAGIDVDLFLIAAPWYILSQWLKGPAHP